MIPFLVIVGDGGVGKTALFCRHIFGEFDVNYYPPTMLDTFSKRYFKQGVPIRLK